VVLHGPPPVEPQSAERDPAIEVKVRVLDEEPGYEIEGRLRKTGIGGMQLLLPVPLADGVSLRVEYDKYAVYGQALYTKPVASGAYLVGFGVETDGRREPRMPADERARLTYLHPRRRGRVQGRVVDISQSGLGLMLREAITPGTEVMVKMRDRAVCGEVRHCRPVEGGYRAGLEISEVLVRETRGRSIGGLVALWRAAFARCLAAVSSRRGGVRR
jgi:PilZ domain